MIDPEKIGMLIGPGGKNIKAQSSKSRSANRHRRRQLRPREHILKNKDSLERARQEIRANHLPTSNLARPTRQSSARSRNIGAFVECLPGKEGLVHVSELADFRVNRVEDVASSATKCSSSAFGIDDKGKCRLSRRAAIMEQQGLP